MRDVVVLTRSYLWFERWLWSIRLLEKISVSLCIWISKFLYFNLYNNMQGNHYDYPLWLFYSLTKIWLFSPLWIIIFMFDYYLLHFFILSVSLPTFHSCYRFMNIKLFRTQGQFILSGELKSAMLYYAYILRLL